MGKTCDEEETQSRDADGSTRSQLPEHEEVVSDIPSVSISGCLTMSGGTNVLVASTCTVERISLMFCLFANVNVPTSEK
jgi:hypothetical protein